MLTKGTVEFHGISPPLAEHMASSEVPKRFWVSERRRETWLDVGPKKAWGFWRFYELIG
jgi:hypothetical protein